MPVVVTRSEEPGVWSAAEVTITGDGSSASYPIDMIVGDGSELLIVTLTENDGPSGFMRGPRLAEFTIVDPQGRNRGDLLQRAPNGQFTLVAEKPVVGRWTVTVHYGSDASAELNTSVLTRGPVGKMARLGRFIRCKSCKLGLKAAIVALLVHLAPLIAGGLGVAAALAKLTATLGSLIAAVEQALGIGHAALVALSEVLSEYWDDPIDAQLHRVCHFIKLCDA